MVCLTCLSCHLQVSDVPGKEETIKLTYVKQHNVPLPLYEENLDLSNTEEELDTDENDETEDLTKEKLDQLPVKQNPNVTNVVGASYTMIS